MFFLYIIKSVISLISVFFRLSLIAAAGYVINQQCQVTYFCKAAL